MLREKGMHIICRKDFKPTIDHEECSEYFVGSNKTYLNKIPTVTPEYKKQLYQGLLTVEETIT